MRLPLTPLSFHLMSSEFTKLNKTLFFCLSEETQKKKEASFVGEKHKVWTQVLLYKVSNNFPVYILSAEYSLHKITFSSSSSRELIACHSPPF